MTLDVSRLFRAYSAHQLDPKHRELVTVQSRECGTYRDDLEQKAKPESLKRLDRSASWLQDDRYLKPVIEDDALLRESVSY